MDEIIDQADAPHALPGADAPLEHIHQYSSVALSMS
jgi:hypothetical protein